jgi:hypothetical protein
MQARAISYQLFFEGDIDSNGDTGTVVTWPEWGFHDATDSG